MRRNAATALLAVMLLAGASSPAPAEEPSRAAWARSGWIAAAAAGRPLLVTECQRDANDYGQGPGIETDRDGEDNAAHGREDGRGRAPDGRPLPCERARRR